MRSQILLACGSNARGQLATGNCEDAHTFRPSTFLGHPPGALPAGTALVQLACGANHTLALLAGPHGPELWGCGDGRRGQLGPADVHPDNGGAFRPLSLGPHLRPGYAPRRVAAAWETSYVVLSCAGADDVLLAMGADDFGALGVGAGAGAAGAGPHIVAVPLGTPDRADSGRRTIDLLAAGPRHVLVWLAMARDGAGAVVGWGASRHGQLGGPAPAPAATPLPRVVEEAAGAGAPMGAALGSQHTVLLHADGRVSGLGAGRRGELDGLEGLVDVGAVGCTWGGTYVLVRGERVWRVCATGSGARGQLGRVLGAEGRGLAPVEFPFDHATRRLEKMACGSEHVLCLFSLVGDVEREVWGWGWNEHGNMGVGSLQDIVLPQRLWPLEGDGKHQGRVVDIWGGCGTSWIVLEREA